VTADPATEQFIEAGNDVLDLVLAHDTASPVRVHRLGLRGRARDLPPGQPAVELVTVDAGHAPPLDRLTGGVVSRRMRYARHEDVHEDGVRVVTVHQQEEGGHLRTALRLELLDGVAAVRVQVLVTNGSPQEAPVRPRTLLSLATLALQTALGSGGSDDPGQTLLSWAPSDWVGEGRWRTRSLREAGLPELRLASHEGGARGCLAFASTGNWSTGRVLPTGVLEGTGGALAWAVEHNGSWRWELAEAEAGVHLALSGPTDSDHGWSVRLEAGQEFRSVPVVVAAGEDLGAVVAALTTHRRRTRRDHRDNRELAVVYNDYMNTLMGDPSTEVLLPLVDAAAEAGAEVFCIDAGWYDDGADWWFGVGEWQPATTRFPRGIQEVLQRIRDRDMRPGLWLEPEAVGVDTAVARRLPDAAFLQRGGERLVEHGRHHLDLRHPAATAHLDEVVDRLVDELGVEYFKLDHNINPSPGSDVGATSAGDALLQHQRALLRWLDGVLDRHPGVVLENCASGAMRADAAMLSRLQLQSTSDQQDPQAYPPIAAAAPLSILPEQAANWAYPQPEMDEEEAAFTLCTGLLGRLYLSGHLDRMTVAQRVLVAEAVAAHKRLRTGLPAAQASWPLGVEQWDAPWVALALDGEDASHLTLWRRRGASQRVEVPLPRFAGGELDVRTVFPTRLEPWRFSWDSARGVLTVVATSAPTAARVLRLSARPPVADVDVHLATSTGAVHGGASGMLYGLAEPGVPSAALVSGAAPRTMAQKAPGGLQHPGGDALELADSYFAAGGGEMLVYLQDALRQWPYEQVGTAAYRGVVQDAVRAVSARDDRGRFTWVPFNEGDWIWYPDWEGGDRERFLEDWTTIVRAVREVDPEARVAGPNEARFHPQRVRDFLAHCREHDVLPDVVSWHELQPSSLESYPAHYRHFRALERELGIGPLPVNVDEYANRRDMSVPAQLLQWLEMFETTKVDADLAYWTMAGNLDDHAVGQQQANAGWWLLHWYAGLRGETVHVDVPHPVVRDSLRALAATDVEARHACVLVGGGRDAVRLRLHDAAAHGWEGRVRVRTSRLVWSGCAGEVSAPEVLADEVRKLEGAGPLDVLLPAGAASTVLRVDVTPDGGGAPARPAPWSTHVDTAAARVAEVGVRRHGEDWQDYAGWGREAVSGFTHPGSWIEFDVDVPADGRYRLGLLHGTDAQPARLALQVDDGPREVLELAPTLTRSYAARHDHEVELQGGHHRLRFSGVDGGGGPEVSVDRLEVRALTPAGPLRLDAVFARRGPGAVVEHHAALSGPGSAVLPAGAELTSFVGAVRRGAHRLEVAADALDGGPDADAVVEVRVAGRRLPLRRRTSGVFEAVATLPLGISEVVVAAGSRGARVHHLSVEAPPAGGSADVVTAAAARLEGPARLTPAATGRAARVTGWRAGADGGAAHVPVELPAGEHLLTCFVSNADRLSGHEYNADVVTRRLRVQAVDGAGPVGEAVEVAVGHTHHWDHVVEVSVALDTSRAATHLLLDVPRGAGPELAGLVLEPLHHPPSPR